MRELSRGATLPGHVEASADAPHTRSMEARGDGLERFLPAAADAQKTTSQLALPDGEFGGALRSSLSALYEDRGGAELELTVEGSSGKGVACHAFVLETWSPVLRAQLSSRWAGGGVSGPRSVEAPGGSRPAVEALVAFCYTGRCSVDDDSVLPLLRLSDFWGVAHLRELCGSFLFETSRSSDSGDLAGLVEKLKIADEFGLARLRQRCASALAAKFDELFRAADGDSGKRSSPLLLELAPDMVGEVLCKSRLAVVDEADVLDRAGQESEIPNFKGSSLGRFPLVSADFWTSDHLLERSRSVDAFSGTRARGTLTLKRR